MAKNDAVETPKTIEPVTHVVADAPPPNMVGTFPPYASTGYPCIFVLTGTAVSGDIFIEQGGNVFSTVRDFVAVEGAETTNVTTK